MNRKFMSKSKEEKYENAVDKLIQELWSGLKQYMITDNDYINFDPLYSCYDDPILERQHVDINGGKVPIPHAQKIRALLKDICTTHRKSTDIISDRDFFCRLHVLSKRDISFRIPSSSDFPNLLHPPVLLTGYFPINCDTEHKRIQYLYDRYKESNERYYELIPVPDNYREHRMLRIPAEKNILRQFHMAGRHIHGFFHFLTNGRRKYMADIFNNFLFPIDIPYEAWDVRLKIAFDRISTYNLHLVEILEKNLDFFKLNGPNFYQCYPRVVFENERHKPQSRENRKLKMGVQNKSLFEKHPEVISAGVKDLEQERMLANWLKNNGSSGPISTSKNCKQDEFPWIPACAQKKNGRGRPKKKLHEEQEVPKTETGEVENEQVHNSKFMNLDTAAQYQDFYTEDLDSERNQNYAEEPSDFQSWEPTEPSDGARTNYSLFNIHDQIEIREVALILLQGQNVQRVMESEPKDNEMLKSMCDYMGVKYKDMLEQVSKFAERKSRNDIVSMSGPFLQNISKCIRYYHNPDGKYWNFELSDDIIFSGALESLKSDFERVNNEKQNHFYEPCIKKRKLSESDALIQESSVSAPKNKVDDQESRKIRFASEIQVENEVEIEQNQLDVDVHGEAHFEEFESVDTASENHSSSDFPVAQIQESSEASSPSSEVDHEVVVVGQYPNDSVVEPRHVNSNEYQGQDSASQIHDSPEVAVLQDDQEPQLSDVQCLEPIGAPMDEEVSDDTSRIPEEPQEVPSLFNIHCQSDEIREFACRLLENANLQNLIEKKRENKELLDWMCDFMGYTYKEILEQIKELALKKRENLVVDESEPFLRNISKCIRYYHDQNGRCWEFELSTDAIFSGELESQKSDFNRNHDEIQKYLGNGYASVEKSRKVSAPEEKEVPQAKKIKLAPEFEVHYETHFEDVEARFEDVYQDQEDSESSSQTSQIYDGYAQYQCLLAKGLALEIHKLLEVIDFTAARQDSESSPGLSRSDSTSADGSTPEVLSMIAPTDQIETAPEARKESVASEERKIETEIVKEISLNPAESEFHGESQGEVTFQCTIEKLSARRGSNVTLTRTEVGVLLAGLGRKRKISQVEVEVRDSEVLKTSSEADPLSSEVGFKQDQDFFTKDLNTSSNSLQDQDQNPAQDLAPEVDYSSEDLDQDPTEVTDLDLEMEDQDCVELTTQDSEFVKLASEVDRSTRFNAERDQDHLEKDTRIDDALQDQDSTETKITSDVVAQSEEFDMEPRIEESASQFDVSPEVPDVALQQDQEASTQDLEVEDALRDPESDALVAQNQEVSTEEPNTKKVTSSRIESDIVQDQDSAEIDVEQDGELEVDSSRIENLAHDKKEEISENSIEDSENMIENTPSKNLDEVQHQDEDGSEYPPQNYEPEIENSEGLAQNSEVDAIVAQNPEFSTEDLDVDVAQEDTQGSEFLNVTSGIDKSSEDLQIKNSSSKVENLGNDKEINDYLEGSGVEDQNCAQCATPYSEITAPQDSDASVVPEFEEQDQPESEVQEDESTEDLAQYSEIDLVVQSSELSSLDVDAQDQPQNISQLLDQYSKSQIDELLNFDYNMAEQDPEFLTQILKEAFWGPNSQDQDSTEVASMAAQQASESSTHNLEVDAAQDQSSNGDVVAQDQRISERDLDSTQLLETTNVASGIDSPSESHVEQDPESPYQDSEEITSNSTSDVRDQESSESTDVQQNPESSAQYLEVEIPQDSKLMNVSSGINDTSESLVARDHESRSISDVREQESSESIDVDVQQDITDSEIDVSVTQIQEFTTDDFEEGSRIVDVAQEEESTEVSTQFLNSASEIDQSSTSQVSVAEVSTEEVSEKVSTTSTGSSEWDLQNSPSNNGNSLDFLGQHYAKWSRSHDDDPDSTKKATPHPEVVHHFSKIKYLIAAQDLEIEKLLSTINQNPDGTKVDSEVVNYFTPEVDSSTEVNDSQDQDVSKDSSPDDGFHINYGLARDIIRDCVSDIRSSSNVKPSQEPDQDSTKESTKDLNSASEVGFEVEPRHVEHPRDSDNGNSLDFLGAHYARCSRYYEDNAEDPDYPDSNAENPQESSSDDDAEIPNN